MKTITRLLTFVAIFFTTILSCSSHKKTTSEEESLQDIAERVFTLARTQLKYQDSLLQEKTLPRTLDKEGNLVTSDAGWWCSGFFPGSLWLTYQYTKDPEILKEASNNTYKLYVLADRDIDHDIGFQIMSSFERAYLSTGDEKYLPMVRQSAKRLAGRFSPVTKTIKSWNGDKWEWPVIIDNMMNLELLTTGARLIGGAAGDSLMKVAVTHATTTMNNHFREDNTCYHLLDYSTTDGHVKKKQTVQGYSDESAWARGQAWALYGYTMMARETSSLKDITISQSFLKKAEDIARMLLSRLPEEDGIPFWDFDDPKIPEALKDASAGAVMASAFVELSSLTKDKTLSESCKAMYQKQLRALASEKYLAGPRTNGGFLLKHSVGNLPENSEVDVPLSYADYYFLEALSRCSKSSKKSSK